jgi:hypothetical protein
MLIWLPLNSQITLKEGKAAAILSDNGDTLIVMHVNDAKQILTDVLQCEILDTLVIYYENKDKVNTKIIQTQKEVEVKLNNKIKNLESLVLNLEGVVVNKDKEITIKDEIIKIQKREIRKQKILKVAGFTGSIVLPVVTALLLLK